MGDLSGLTHGRLSNRCVHLCVDMQRLFAEETDWRTPWMERVLPNVRRIVEAHAAQTVFTRFMPRWRPGDGQGTWKRYYEHWSSMTIEHLGEDMTHLIPALARHVPPAVVIDKAVYSPWLDETLDRVLRERRCDTLIVTSGETEVCVLGTVLGAVDRGYRVVVVTDALCSSSDETHEASLSVYSQRYGQQVETIETDGLLAAWI